MPTYRPLTGADPTSAILDEEAVSPDLDMAFAAPEHYAMWWEQRAAFRTSDCPEKAMKRKSDSPQASGNQMSPWLRTRLCALGRKARNSLRSWANGKRVITAESDVDLLDFTNDEVDRLDSVNMLNSPGSSHVLSFSSVTAMRSVHSLELLEDLSDTPVSLTRTNTSWSSTLAVAGDASLYLPENNAELALRIENSLEKSCRTGAFADVRRKRRFRLAVGNNTTEAARWAASATHIRAVLAHTASNEEGFQQSQTSLLRSEDGARDEDGMDSEMSFILEV